MTRGMGSYPGPVLDESGYQQVCSHCTCFWRLPEWEQHKDEWCSEPEREIGCTCHHPAFREGMLDAADRLDAAEETVIGFVNPDGSGEGNWATVVGVPSERRAPASDASAINRTPPYPTSFRDDVA